MSKESRFLNIALSLMIVVGQLDLSCGEKLNCTFTEFGPSYGCEVKSLENSSNNKIIDGYFGVHLENKNDSDVQAIQIHNTNVKYIPENLGIPFNLILLMIEKTDLVEIKAKDFKEMQNLIYLVLMNNKITSLPSDVFHMLKSLNYLDLTSNQIEEIPNGLFSNNLNLESVYLNKNLIMFIAPGLFNDLTMLNVVAIEQNMCLNEWYKGTTELAQMKVDIKLNCTKPNEIPTTTTTTTTPPPNNGFMNVLSKLIRINDQLKGNK